MKTVDPCSKDIRWNLQYHYMIVLLVLKRLMTSAQFWRQNQNYVTWRHVVRFPQIFVRLFLVIISYFCPKFEVNLMFRTKVGWPLIRIVFSSSFFQDINIGNWINLWWFQYYLKFIKLVEGIFCNLTWQRQMFPLWWRLDIFSTFFPYNVLTSC